jgi:uncharacterized YigZ family protein
MFSIKNNDKYELIIKNSKFISLIFRVYSKDEVNDILYSIKKEYPNATHYCYGYVIDSDIRANDDNEPSGTAGYPILNQITSNYLNYTLIVVIRYFGGIKLGAGPLTRTYAKVAREVIRDNNIIELEKGYDIDIIFNYNDTIFVINNMSCSTLFNCITFAKHTHIYLMKILLIMFMLIRVF